MTNKASASLAALMALGGDAAQAADAGAALDRITPDEDTRQAAPGDDEDRAKFGTPEAVATAVAASFILGPIGGLIMGGAQGWLKKRSDQNILDAIASEQNVLADAASVYDQVLQGFKAGAKNPEDLSQIATMEAQRLAATKLMASGDPTLRDQGMAAFADFETNASNFAALQETQRIELEAEDKRLRIELDERQYNRYTGLQADFTNESAAFLKVSQSVNTALAALQSGTPADLHAAVVLVNKALDPESVVRAEEARAFGNMGSRLEKTAKFLLEEFAGQTLTAGQRRDLGALLVTIQDESTAFQLTREARFSDNVTDANLPEQYHDNFRLVKDVPAAISLDIPDDALDATRTAAGITGDAVGTVVERVIQGTASAFDKFKEQNRNEAAGIADAFNVLNPTN